MGNSNTRANTGRSTYSPSDTWHSNSNKEAYKEDTTMTRKHFEMIAQIMHDTKPPDNTPSMEAYHTWLNIIDTMCYEFRQVNANFDSARFERFCKEGK